MFTMSAPHPSVQTTSVLPHPIFSNSEATIHDLSVKRSTDGTTRTYVKRKTQRKSIWSFRLDRMKALELKAFVMSYHSSKIRIVDHCDQMWVGYMMNNPFEWDTTGLSIGGVNSNGVRNEKVSITIEFRGELIA